MKSSKEIRREFTLLAALSSTQKPDIAWLQTQTGIPRSTIARLLGVLRREFGMEIRFVRDSDSGEGQGRYGYYNIADWGIVDKQAFRERHRVFSGDLDEVKKAVGG